MKVYSGIIKKVLTDEQYELIAKNEIKPGEISLEDTIREASNEKTNEIVNYIPIKLAYKETDNNGNDKFIFNEEKDDYQKVYNNTPTLYASGKEMRIILELGEFSPVKICCEKIPKSDGLAIHTVRCVQNQLCGKL